MESFPSPPTTVPGVYGPIAGTASHPSPSDNSHEIMGPYEIQREMERCMDELDRLVADTETVAFEKVELERDFKVAFATARVKFRSNAATGNAKVTVDQINDHATLATADQEQAFNHSDERLKYLNAARRSVESKLDTLRSMSAAIRGAGG